MSILTTAEASRIISKSMYWDEVLSRENAGPILMQEAMAELKLLGPAKVLTLITEYAKGV